MIQDLGAGWLDNAWAPDRMPMPDDYLLVFEGRSLAVGVGEDDGYTFLRLADTPALGMDDCGTASLAEGMSRSGDDSEAAKPILVAGASQVEGVAHGTRGSEAELTYYFSLDGTVVWGIAPASRSGGIGGTGGTASRSGGTASQPVALSSQPDDSALVRTACGREGIDFLDLSELRRRSASNAQMLAVYTAWHLSEWYRTHRLCGVCGTPLRHAHDERALQCPSCTNRVYPRINPAVIVGVCDPSRGRIVLTRYARNRGVTYDALIAGFAEIGETFEQCVAREVREEVGLAVKNIRYAGSQPWGIASDLLAGFWCEVDGDATLRVDESELSRAVWAAPSDIVGQPDDLSLTNWMMCSFRDGTSPFGPQVA